MAVVTMPPPAPLDLARPTLESSMAPSLRPTVTTSSAQSSASISIDANHPKSPSPPTSPGTSGSFVPQYPFSVALPYLPGSNANITGYFSNSANQPLPDDSDVQTRLPSICVDYLSHDWKEDDIWTSWKAMTKHKADLVNGVRLENASWRTWAKQRSKLRTISPETLNWLKDSDVTWLYGPLHTAVEPVPPAKAATMEDRLNLDPQTALRHAANPIQAPVRRGNSEMSRSMARQPAKPILKHRSLSDILSVPSHRRLPEFTEDEGEDSSEGRATSDAGSARSGVSPNRGDHTTVQRAWTRRAQPPAAIATEWSATSPDAPTVEVQTPSERSASASADELEPVRKHISFNHFVEQCIAVDSDEEPGFYESQSSGTSDDDDDDDDDEDEEDDALSFRSSPRSHTFPLAKPHLLHVDRDKEPHTIAKLAPTVLKSSEHVYPSPSPVVVFNGQVIGENGPFAAPLNGHGASVHWEADPPVTSPKQPTSQWDDDDDESGTTSYFAAGADLGVGDEYTAGGTQHGPPRKASTRSPTDQSPSSSSGPSSPNLPSSPNVTSTASYDPRSSGVARSILKSRSNGPQNADNAIATGASPPKASPIYASYADAAKAVSVAPVSRGRSISRGSSSSSLDRSASQDSRRTSPAVGPGEPERGRTFRRNNSSGSSLNNLSTSPSNNASDTTLYAQSRSGSEGEPALAVSPTPASISSSHSSSASLDVAADAGHLGQGAGSAGASAPKDPPDDPSYVARDFARVESADFEKDATFLFDSPHMPSSPNSSSVELPRNNSFSAALQSVRWSDDEPSAARRALLRAQSRDHAAAGATGRRRSHDGAFIDDYGLNLAGFSDDEESGGVVSRAVEIAGTARDLVGALWTVAFRRS